LKPPCLHRPFPDLRPHCVRELHVLSGAGGPACGAQPLGHIRFSVLRQRQTALLQRLRRSAPVLRHQPAGRGGRRAEEGTEVVRPHFVFSPSSANDSYLHPPGSPSQWKAEIRDFCPSTRILLIGCKTDLRTDVCTRMELSNQKQTPVSHEQGSSLAKQLGAEAYLECSAFTSEKSIHSVFRTAALACLNQLQPADKPSPVRRLSKRLLHLPSKTELLSSTFGKDKSRSCSVM
uniref:Rho family GTPase 1 n=1 Tax=Gasterosteus aculeatus aculeatus TaxID=481459 RepID=A0AAQ4QH29_GASAC